MTDETKLQEDAARGQRAKSLLENELLIEAFASLEQAYIDKWRTTPVSAVADREKLFLAVNIAGKVQEHLARVVADGSMAASELRQMAEEIQRVAERRKRFGVV